MAKKEQAPVSATFCPASLWAWIVASPNSIISPKPTISLPPLFTMEMTASRAAPKEEGLELYVSSTRIIPSAMEATSNRPLIPENAPSPSLIFSGGSFRLKPTAAAAKALVRLWIPGTLTRTGQQLSRYKRSKRIPSGPSLLILAALTSFPWPRPKVIFCFKNVEALFIRGSSSPFRITRPFDEIFLMSSVFAFATPSRSDNPSRWAIPTLRITPTSGSAISVSREISPGRFIPISSTALL